MPKVTPKKIAEEKSTKSKLNKLLNKKDSTGKFTKSRFRLTMSISSKRTKPSYHLHQDCPKE